MRPIGQTAAIAAWNRSDRRQSAQRFTLIGLVWALALVTALAEPTTGRQAPAGVDGAVWPQWRGPGRDGKITGFAASRVWPETLAKKWRVAVGAGDATPVLADGKLYVFVRQGNEEVTLCLDAATGEQIWRDAYESPGIDRGPASAHAGPRSSPALAHGKLVTLNLGGVLSCLDAKDGKLLWYKDPYTGVFPRFYTSSSPIIVGQLAIGRFGGGDQGAIIAFDLASGAEKRKWEGDGADYA